MGDNGHHEIVAIHKLSARESLAMHLQFNCYPPVHPVFLSAVEEAIKEARAGNLEKKIRLPNGKVFTAEKIVSDLRLDNFLGKESDESEETTDD